MPRGRWGPPRWTVASRVALAAATLVAARAGGESRHEPHLLGSVAAEAGAISRPVFHELHASDPGAAMVTTIDRVDRGALIGGRAEVKYLFVSRSAPALGPRLAYSLATPPVPHDWTLATEIASYSVRDRYRLHALTIGFELQGLRRQFLFAADLGLAHAVDRSDVTSAELDGGYSDTMTWPLVRNGVGGRWPLGDRVALTVTGSVELGLQVPPLARASLALGIEFDAGPAPMNRPPPDRRFKRRAD